MAVPIKTIGLLSFALTGSGPPRVHWTTIDYMVVSYGPSLPLQLEEMPLHATCLLEWLPCILHLVSTLSEMPLCSVLNGLNA